MAAINNTSKAQAGSQRTSKAVLNPGFQSKPNPNFVSTTDLFQQLSLDLLFQVILGVYDVDAI
jgi:hypothetical protein